MSKPELISEALYTFPPKIIVIYIFIPLTRHLFPSQVSVLKILLYILVFITYRGFNFQFIPDSFIGILPESQGPRKHFSYTPLYNFLYFSLTCHILKFLITYFFNLVYFWWQLSHIRHQKGVTHRRLNMCLMNNTIFMECLTCRQDLYITTWDIAVNKS